MERNCAENLCQNSDSSRPWIQAVQAEVDGLESLRSGLEHDLSSFGLLPGLEINEYEKHQEVTKFNKAPDHTYSCAQYADGSEVNRSPEDGTFIILGPESQYAAVQKEILGASIIGFSRDEYQAMALKPWSGGFLLLDTTHKTLTIKNPSGDRFTHTFGDKPDDKAAGRTFEQWQTVFEAIGSARNLDVSWQDGWKHHIVFKN